MLWSSDDGLQLYVQYRSGLTATVGLPEALGAEVGDVVLISDQGLTVAPDEVWPKESWIGVVRKHLGGTALVAGRGDVKLVDTNAVECREDDTVEVDDFVGITQKLADHPVTYMERLDFDAADVEKFKRTEPEELTFEDFGGLEKVKRRARELVELPLEHHDALAKIGARPIKGVLFTGLPGTGKTMLARIIASLAQADFYEISGPQIFSKWVGESEALLRAIFEDAADQKRSIIFFDEIDSVAPRRASDANEASRRVVAQLLTEMDGFKPEQNVVVIAATNRADDLDDALRRPGRFDWEVEFPLPHLEDRAEILRVSAAKLRTVEDLSHEDIAKRTEGWSSAALSAIWSEAALLAVADGREIIMDEDFYGGFERVAEQRRRIVPRKEPETPE